jgi:hypothetical protein
LPRLLVWVSLAASLDGAWGNYIKIEWLLNIDGID